MKKNLALIVLFLFVMMLFASCASKEVEETKPFNEENTSSNSETTDSPLNDETQYTENESKAPSDTSETKKPSDPFAKNEDELTVIKKQYAKSNVNVREKPSTDSKIITTISKGEAVDVAAESKNGWTGVIYEGKLRYISSSYLSDTKESSEFVDPGADERITVNLNEGDFYLVCVNMYRAMPENYKPQLRQIFSTGYYMETEASIHYEQMYTAAKKDGIILTPFSGYRSYERQKNNYINLTKNYMSTYSLSEKDAAKKAATVILPPGTSEHNLGLAMDICNTKDSFANTKEYKWLTENAADYGFILRYTAEKQKYTGIVPEPWHWRYVGTKYAKDIKNSGKCLEEYLGLAKN